jgi:hypothetical protein
LQDERSGAIIVLDNVVQKFDDALVATIHLPGSSDVTSEVREGDLISSGGDAYRISHLQSDPAGMIVTREQSGLPVGTKLLRPIEGKQSMPANISENPTKPPFRPATGIVDNVK